MGAIRATIAGMTAKRERRSDRQRQHYFWKDLVFYRLAWFDQEVFLCEQTDFLQDIPANTNIFLAFKTQFKNVQNRFFRHDETFLVDISNPL